MKDTEIVRQVESFYHYLGHMNKAILRFRDDAKDEDLRHRAESSADTYELLQDDLIDFFPWLREIQNSKERNEHGL